MAETPTAPPNAAGNANANAPADAKANTAAASDTSTARLVPDIGRLERWLAAHVAGYRGPLSVERMTGGQSNPTFRLTTPGASYVLRRKPPGPLLPRAHAIEREFRVMAALAPTGVPVPHTYALCPDEDIVGTAFFVMELVQGRTILQPSDPSLAPAERRQLFDSMNRTIATLHNVDPAAIGLADFGPPKDYLQRTVDRWTKHYRQSETAAIPAMERLMRWLPENLPPPGEKRVLHGDFRLDNLIVHPTEPRVVAVIDWELATIGDPLSDFAYHCMLWRFDPDLFRGVAGLDLAALGIPPEADYVAAYAERRGLPSVPNWHFYLAINMFRFAAILQGVYRRSLQGNAVGLDSAAMGAKVGPIADLAWAEAELAAAESGRAMR